TRLPAPIARATREKIQRLAKGEGVPAALGSLETGSARCTRKGIGSVGDGRHCAVRVSGLSATNDRQPRVCSINATLQWIASSGRWWTRRNSLEGAQGKQTFRTLPPCTIFQRLFAHETVAEDQARARGDPDSDPRRPDPVGVRVAWGICRQVRCNPDAC